MKIFARIISILALLVIIFLAYAATRPDSFSVQRSTAIQAPPQKIFALIDDFKAWPAWSPWEKLDPAMTRSFSATTSGKGANYAWAGDSKAGAGRMEIIDDAAPTSITIKLDFIKPIESSNKVVFTLEPKGDATTVTWTMNGPSPFVSKVLGVFFNMDEMIGGDFETGLGNLKAFAEDVGESKPE